MTWEEEHLRSTACHFTKHRGESWYSVVQIDRDYAEWIVLNQELPDELYEALKWGIRHIPDKL